MALTAAEKELVDKYDLNKYLLEPFTRITEQWGVVTQHKFQTRIHDIHLVASEDLENDWSVKVVAGTTGVVVAEFSFKEYGRIRDMRPVDYTKPVPAFLEWIESKIDKRQIKYSKVAESRGLQYSDPRVIHDLAYRIMSSINKKGVNPKRRRWYNKGKESSLSDLYDKLAEAAQEVAVRVAKRGLQEAA